MSTERVAFMLLAELNRLLGHVPPIEQIDFVRCEGGGNFWMVYPYFRDGSECDPFVLENPPPFDRRAVEHSLVRGCQETLQ